MLDRAISIICANCARRYPFLDIHDMRQTAEVAALEARRTWRRGGAPLHLYQARAAALAVRLYCAKARCPVSGWAGNLDALAACHGVPLVGLTRAATEPDPETHYYRRQLAAEIRRILGRLTDGHLAALVLLGEHKPAEVARQQRRPMREIYRATHRAYRALASSRTLRQYAQ